MNALRESEEARAWPKVRRRLGVADPQEIRRILFGDGHRIPRWAGYTIGFRIVLGYLERHPRSRPAVLVATSPARAIYEASGYLPRTLAAT